MIGSEATDQAVRLRRHLHQHPELRFEEHRTSLIVANLLKAAGFDVRSGIAGTGVVGSITRGSAIPHVALRSDIDALPIPDLKSVPYTSTVQNISHACGHDVHTAVAAITAARVAASPGFRGRLTVIFQPAEEIPFGQLSGASEMIKAGALSGPPIDAIFALHCWPSLPAGVVGLNRGSAMAAKDAFHIALDGRASHASSPASGRDSIAAISSLVTCLHASVGRRVNPEDLRILNVGTIKGGTTQSIVPDHAEITGTIRTIDPVVRESLRKVVESAVEGTASAWDVQPSLVWANSMPIVTNDDGLFALAQRILPRLLGEDNFRELSNPGLATDDFALFAKEAPGLYLKLGTRGDDVGGEPLHTACFDVDETCLTTGIETLSHLLFEASDSPIDGMSVELSESVLSTLAHTVET